MAILSSLRNKLLVAALIGVLIVEAIMWPLTNAIEHRVQRELLDEGAKIRAELESRLTQAIYLSVGLVSYIQSQNGQLEKDRIKAWLQRMRANSNAIINIGIAPNNRIQFIFPEKGNESAMGLYYPDLPTQWPDVRRMIESQKPVLAGPLALVQGGNGLIYRHPIFIDGAYWGLISTVMDSGELLAPLTMDARQEALNIALAKRTGDGDGSVERIWGEAIEEDGPQQTMGLELPGATWRLTVQGEPSPDILTFRLGLYAALVIILLMIAALLRHNKRERARRDTIRAETDRLKDEFIATVSHELRTPLTNIRGTLGLLEGGAAGELPDKAQELVTMARRNSDHQTQLINELLDIEKIVAGRMPIHLQPCAVQPQITSVVADNQTLADRRQVHLHVSEVDSNACVIADAQRLRQVLTNLLSNAIKFSPAGGEVTISAQREADQWSLSIADQGPGIPEWFQPRLFERFSQADGSSTRDMGGTGLGLAICKGLMTQMNGDIRYDTCSAGTVFTVTFAACDSTTTP
ncbi:hypothetical protein CF392_02865 [Tamilnaduibacter salinus]|uniref:histidine kinase n=1 Tax=Tamilnaduibacter salinus TaxID=1484056 RepID=A0A2A2I5T0_9GAMM|nr:ATP-binding protein [Tamilnaduibacter salinus]PAV27089.1 hypothetical protein CF392_02865 [Tamilnaduibacter salinus]